MEHEALPDSVNIEIDMETGNFNEKENKTEKKIIRELQCSVVMRPDIAKSVGEWLIKHSDNLLNPLQK